MAGEHMNRAEIEKLIEMFMKQQVDRLEIMISSFAERQALTVRMLETMVTTVSTLEIRVRENEQKIASNHEQLVDQKHELHSAGNGYPPGIEKRLSSLEKCVDSRFTTLERDLIVLRLFLKPQVWKILGPALGVAVSAGVAAKLGELLHLWGTAL